MGGIIEASCVVLVINFEFAVELDSLAFVGDLLDFFTGERGCQDVPLCDGSVDVLSLS